MKLFKSLYLHTYFYYGTLTVVVAFVLSFFFPVVYDFAWLLFWLMGVAVFLDILLLYRWKEALSVSRNVPEKFSNGDENPVQIDITSLYNFPVRVEIIDELPFQFQKRDLSFNAKLKKSEQRSFQYDLRPTERGDYKFGKVNVFVRSFLSLACRRFQFDKAIEVPTYPSFIQMRKYELIAISNRLSDYGVKKIRKIGNQKEFDQIREYVKGDDYRTINWKATARKGAVMVNQYQDEKSQAIYSIIDCGRSMKMPFNGLTLQDYAINTSLVLSNIAVLKQDKAGLICFDDQVKHVVLASSKKTQVKKIMEHLYNEKTAFPEPNFELLCSSVKRYVKGRSLLMLYTNFESADSMRRNLPYLLQLSKRHLLLIVFFSNSEIEDLMQQKMKNVEEIYLNTIAEKQLYDKKLIVKELNRNGIHAIVTKPENLTANSLNKYLELKGRGLL